MYMNRLASMETVTSFLSELMEILGEKEKIRIL